MDGAKQTTDTLEALAYGCLRNLFILESFKNVENDRSLWEKMKKE